MGFAFNGKAYSNGVVPISRNIAVDIGFREVSGGIKISPIAPKSICDLIVPGAYSTNLSELKTMDGFNGFMGNCFSTPDTNVPVLILVPQQVVRQVSEYDIKKQLILLHYSQYCEANNVSYNREAVYNALSDKPVPELNIDDMKHLSYKEYGGNYKKVSIGDVNIEDFINNKIEYNIYYDNSLIFFYTVQPTAYITLYVGGYGFKVYYPANYVFLNIDTNEYILIRRCETPYITQYTNKLDSYQRNYTFTGYQTSSGSFTLAWMRPDPDKLSSDNGGITSTYENQGITEISVGIPYNPIIHTIFGQGPFTERITLASNLSSFNNVGAAHVGSYNVADITYAFRVQNDLGVDKCLPLGEYLLPFTNSIGDAPVNSGTYSLNVFSAGNGSLVQQVLTDPGVTEYNKYTRSLSKTNKAYGSWSGTYQI